MLVSPAWAQSGGGGFGGMESLLPLVLIFVVFYFLLIRPQQKKAKVHREMLGNVRRGDRIVTNGGLVGNVTRVPNDTELIVEIADGVKVRIMRAMIAESIAKSGPVSSSKSKGKKKEEVVDDDSAEEYEEEEFDDDTEGLDEGKKN
jgi:preprotein translocase subunit YajC